jgi:hypothetical protein
MPAEDPVRNDDGLNIPLARLACTERHPSISLIFKGKNKFKNCVLEHF